MDKDGTNYETLLGTDQPPLSSTEGVACMVMSRACEALKVGCNAMCDLQNVGKLKAYKKRLCVEDTQGGKEGIHTSNCVNEHVGINILLRRQCVPPQFTLYAETGAVCPSEEKRSVELWKNN